MTEITLSVPQQNKLFRSAYWLAVFTIAYNLIEGIVATGFGYHDETLTLFGFGVDSFIEMISGFGILYMVIRIRQHAASHRSQFERTALRITGWCFYLLVAGLIISASFNLITHQKPTTTFWGIIISSISIVVMIFLLINKIKIGKQLQSDAILADANCTKVCIYMSCILLATSGIYELTGFAYADAIGTLGIAWFSFSEGKECFEKAASDKLCTHHH